MAGGREEEGPISACALADSTREVRRPPAPPPRHTGPSRAHTRKQAGAHACVTPVAAL